MVTEFANNKPNLFFVNLENISILRYITSGKITKRIGLSE